MSETLPPSVAHTDRILHHALVALHLAAPVELAAALLQAAVHQQRVATAAAHRRAAAAAGARSIAATSDGSCNMFITYKSCGLLYVIPKLVHACDNLHTNECMQRWFLQTTYKKKQHILFWCINMCTYPGICIL